MPQANILLDSNSYFRLAKSLHPLLNRKFGKDNYYLYVLPHLDQEFAKNPKLKTKFWWVNDSRYRKNRQIHLDITNKERRRIEITTDILLDHKHRNNMDISFVDVICLAYGKMLSVPVITDDVEMRVVADEFGILVYKTLDLMFLMLKCGHINMQKVREVVCYWEYIGDIPADFRKDYKRIFKKNPPK